MSLILFYLKGGCHLNVLNVPLPNKFTLSKQDLQTRSTINGVLSNGITEIFADISNTKTITTEIKFEVRVNSINVDSFNKWKIQITGILGENIISAIETKIITERPKGEEIKFEQYMSIYSLLVFEYAFNSYLNIDKYINHSMIPFNTDQCTQKQCRQIVDSIYMLESSLVHFQGKLVATEMHPESKAFIPVTFFKFWDNHTVSFAGYRGPITIIKKEGASDKSRIYTLLQKND